MCAFASVVVGWGRTRGWGVDLKSEMWLKWSSEGGCLRAMERTGWMWMAVAGQLWIVEDGEDSGVYRAVVCFGELLLEGCTGQGRIGLYREVYSSGVYTE